MVYSGEAELKISLPKENVPQELLPFKESTQDIPGLMKAVQSSLAEGYEINIYPDAAEFIDACLYKQRMAGLVDDIYKNPQTHPL